MVEARFRVSARAPYPLKEDQNFWIVYDGHIVIALNVTAIHIIMNVKRGYPWCFNINTEKARKAAYGVA